MFAGKGWGSMTVEACSDHTKYLQVFCSTFEEVCRRIFSLFVYVYLYSICILCLCNTLCLYTLKYVECAHIDAGCFRFIRVSWIATQSLSSETADHLQAAAAALAIALADPIFQIALDHVIQPVRNSTDQGLPHPLLDPVLWDELFPLRSIRISNRGTELLTSSLQLDCSTHLDSSTMSQEINSRCP